jgi:hypothetical protein
MPLQAEVRYGASPSMSLDISSDADVVFRVWNLSAGVGGSVRIRDQGSDVRYDCRGLVDCDASGTKTGPASDAIVAGISYSAKLSFGPQGRLFIQGKQIDLSTALDTRGEGTDCSSGTCYNTLAEPYRGGTERRLTTGIVFPNGYRGSKVLRVQWIEQTAKYDLVGKNNLGGMNRKSRFVTIGLVFID